MSADEPAGTARFPGSQRHRGRLVYGLGQTLALWLTVMLVAASVRHIAAAWAGVGVGLVAGLEWCLPAGR